MMLSKKIGIVGLAGALALVIAGCGGATAVTRQHVSKPTNSPKPSATAKGGLTLAEASSRNYITKAPLVNCGTLSPAAQAAWAPLLAGSRIGECAPADYVAKDVPTLGVHVVNRDPSLTQAQANAYGRALLVTFGWAGWTSAADAPAVMNVIGQAGSQYTSYIQLLDQGGTLVSPVPGIAAFPDQLVILPLSKADMPMMANPKENFAIIALYAPFTLRYRYVDPSTATPPFPLTGDSPNNPGIYTGTIATSPVLGTYLSVDTYSNDCSIGDASGLCNLAAIEG